MDGHGAAGLDQFGRSCARVERVSLDERRNAVSQDGDNAGGMHPERCSFTSSIYDT